MKNKIFSVLTSLMLCLWVLPINITFAEDDYSPFKGSGTSSDPYQISSDYELRLLSELVVDEDTETSEKYAKACYIQTADIDLKNENFIPIGRRDNTTEFVNSFKGNYNGNYHKIDNLNIDVTNGGYVGLFSLVHEGTISNLSVSGNVNATGADRNGNWVLCGGIIGEIGDKATIKNCSFTGNVSGDKNGVGGIAGQLVRGGEISSCYFNGTVQTEAESCGGIVGHISDHSVVCTNKVTNCYAVGTVTASKFAGGIAGSSIRNQSDTAYTIDNNYYLDTMADTGINGYITTGCFKLSSNLMKNANELLGEPFVYNDGESINDGYPIFEWQSTPYQFNGSGTAEDPYQIGSKEELETMRDLVNSTYFGNQYCRYYYIQTADIDLENEKWTPIGKRMKDGVDGVLPIFRGGYNGNNYKIINLYVSETDKFAGLFGCMYYGGIIENLEVHGNVNSTASSVGGILGELGVGNSISIVRNCCFIGNVNGKNVGGIVGCFWQSGLIQNCYHIGLVTSDESSTGGIVGRIIVGTDHEGSTVVENCYNIGKVNGLSERTGSIIGFMNDDKIKEGYIYVRNCYYLKDECETGYNGEATECEVTPLTTNLMKKIAEDLGEPFVTNTDPELNDGYPVFEWQLSSQESAIKGDANLDGNIDIADIIAIASYVGDNKNNPLPDEAVVAGDVHNTGDGLTSGDALMIQQYLAGICSFE